MACVANAHTDIAASCNGSHGYPIRVVTISSGSIQYLLDDMPVAVEKGIVEAESSLNSRSGHMLISCPELILDLCHSRIARARDVCTQFCSFLTREECNSVV
ncbi:hypothetical protein Nepgr_012399 [Nepenthes gracilis]|uniref:Uncharacterized protein n=1 Tax=Nepenthes gracilis TaxID=150966 RepID=A0AAD3XN21_NEPGR|nr:hypothetical protein Nepgr_012399 [Nepenthes gracilis]